LLHSWRSRRNVVYPCLCLTKDGVVNNMSNPQYVKASSSTICQTLNMSKPRRQQYVKPSSSTLCQTLDMSKPHNVKASLALPSSPLPHTHPVCRPPSATYTCCLPPTPIDALTLHYTHTLHAHYTHITRTLHAHITLTLHAHTPLTDKE